MSDKPYTKREVDLIMDKMSTHHSLTTAWLEKIDKKVEYTNGKVKRIILALAIMGGLLIGFGFKIALPIIMSLI